MLSRIDLSKKISKKEYKTRFSQLQIKIGKIQREAKTLGVPVVIVFEGWDAAGKGTLINNLILPLDPRGFNVHPISKPNEEESMRPFLWRFWTKTPENGRIAIFDRSWYGKVLVEFIDDKSDSLELERCYQDIRSFERQLSDGGNVMIKFFLHITKKEQKRRFKKLRSNPALSWKVTKEDKKHHKQYDKYLILTERMIEETDTDYAPWTVIESHDRRFAVIKMFETVIHFLEEKINAVKSKKSGTQDSTTKEAVTSSLEDSSLNCSILDKIDLNIYIEKEKYKKSLKKYQKKIRDLEHQIYIHRIPVIITYEGSDAAGKGGNIRRLTQNMDPRGYEVIPIAAPIPYEKRHHYLWRFWNHLPKAGHITIFDRTWYGRVLVERIEGFCTRIEWKRAYREINEMEKHLTEFGTIVIKFWLQIDKDEQLRRFKEREKIEYKNWKITEEDWRNREKWDEYREAVDEMLLRTGTTNAPWTIIESNSKYYARIKVLKTVCERIEIALKKR